MRSDYSQFIDGESFAERVWALLSLTRAGKYNSAYAAELARKAQYLNLESIAAVLYSFALAKQNSSTAEQLEKALWDGIVVRLYQGREMYGGLQKEITTRNNLILPTETRTIAQMTRAVARYDAKNPRLPLLVDSLVTLGRDDGWGPRTRMRRRSWPCRKCSNRPIQAPKRPKSVSRLTEKSRRYAWDRTFRWALFQEPAPGQGKRFFKARQA